MKIRRKSPVSLISTEPQHCSLDLRLKILGRLSFFADLPHTGLEAINRLFVEVGYQPGEWVYMAGEPAEWLYVVAEGKIKILQHGPNGRSVLLDILTTGEFFGDLSLSSGELYPDTAQAQAPACVLRMPSDAFRQVLDEHPGLALKTLQVMAERLNMANRRVLQVSSMTVEKRIAFTILGLGRKFGRSKEGLLLIDVPLSRDDLAEMTAATPETVSRVMSQLQTGGVLESGRQWVGIKDLKALENIAGEA